MSNITRPDMRFMVFESISELRTLKLNIDRGEVVERDVRDLQDILECIEDFVADPAERCIGDVLYDAEEAAAFDRFNRYHIDFDPLGGDWDEVEKFLRGPEFQLLLKLAGDCFGEMMSRDRGVPGFLPHDPSWLPDLTQ